MDDYDEHNKPSIGELMHHINGEVMNYHYKRNGTFPTEPHTLRINREIKTWFELEDAMNNAEEAETTEDTTSPTLPQNI